MLEGVVLQQTRGDALNPGQANAQQHHHQENSLVHLRQQPDGHPKRKKRGASKDITKIIYTNEPLKVESGTTHEKPRKVSGRFDTPMAPESVG